MDHGTGCVIGETAVIGDNVYLMHDVTLGATGTAEGHDRHPKIGRGVFLAAKCTVLGNIEVGAGAIVAAQSLVNRPVPPGYTAVGVPAQMQPPSAKPKVAPSGKKLPPDVRYHTRSAFGTGLPGMGI
jgi:serine O-acetyltransferase